MVGEDKVLLPMTRLNLARLKVNRSEPSSINSLTIPASNDFPVPRYSLSDQLPRWRVRKGKLPKLLMLIDRRAVRRKNSHYFVRVIN
jgi:hypothetical protein